MKISIKSILFFIVGAICLTTFVFAFFDPIQLASNVTSINTFNIALGDEVLKGTPVPFLGFVLILFGGILAITIGSVEKHLSKIMYRNLGLTVLFLIGAGTIMVGCTQYFIIHANKDLPDELLNDMELTIYSIVGIVLGCVSFLVACLACGLKDKRIDKI